MLFLLFPSCRASIAQTDLRSIRPAGHSLSALAGTRGPSRFARVAEASGNAATTDEAYRDSA